MDRCNYISSKTFHLFDNRETKNIILMGLIEF